MITYTTSDGKKFSVFEEAKAHEAELDAIEKQKLKEEAEARAKKEALAKEKASKYAKVMKAVTDCQSLIKQYNAKYNDNISFNIKLHFDGNQRNAKDEVKYSLKPNLDFSDFIDAFFGK